MWHFRIGYLNTWKIENVHKKSKKFEKYITELDQDKFIGKPMSLFTNEPILSNVIFEIFYFL